jgi:photosystem I 4.8kDa protein
MTAKKVSAPAKPNYTFRTAWALGLLAINFLVAAMYFHVLDI